MKPNKLTPGANIFWESSRMMLPQHKEQSFEHLGRPERLTKPELTEEEQQEMFEKLKVAKSNTLEVTIKVFGQYEIRYITGIVTGLDQRQRIIKIEADYDWTLIDFHDVIGVELDVGGY